MALGLSFDHTHNEGQRREHFRELERLPICSLLAHKEQWLRRPSLELPDLDRQAHDDRENSIVAAEGRAAGALGSASNASTDPPTPLRVARHCSLSPR